MISTNKMYFNPDENQHETLKEFKELYKSVNVHYNVQFPDYSLKRKPMNPLYHMKFHKAVLKMLLLISLVQFLLVIISL